MLLRFLFFALPVVAMIAAACSGGGGNIEPGSGAVFNNLSGGLFNFQTNTSFAFNLGGTAPVFNNMAGATFRRTGPDGVATMNVRLQNDGLVDVDTGRLNSTRNGASTGTWDVAGIAELRFTTDYTANLGTEFIGSGLTRMTGGTFTLGSTAVGVDAVTALNLQLAGATLTGSGDLTLDPGGVFTWSSGNLAGAGAINVMRMWLHPAGIRPPLSLKPAGGSFKTTSISPSNPSFLNTYTEIGTIRPARMLRLEGVVRSAKSGRGALMRKR